MIDKVNLINSFNRIYQESKTSTNFEELIKVLEGVKINNLVNYYIHYDKDYDSEDIVLIELIIRILQNIYNNSGILPPVTDESYDTLYEIYNNLTDSNIVGGDSDSAKEKDFHKYPDLRGTLDKVHFINNKEKGKDKRKSIEDWINKSENKLGRKINDYESEIGMYPKFDGISAIFECDGSGRVIKVLTRGNTTNNEAVPITKFFTLLKFTPYSKWGDSEFGVKCEIVMTYKNYEKFCKKYGNFKSPRSAVSSIFNSDEVNADYLKYVTVVPLRMQNFDTKEIIIHPESITNYPVIYSLINKEEFIVNGINTIKTYMKDVIGIPIDGIVLQFRDSDLIKSLGRVDAINRYEVAYKFVPESVKTKIIDVEFSIGLLGAITPVAKIEPVKMEGNTITNVSIGSMDRFESLHLHKGDEVLIKYDIIPYLYIDDTCKQSDGELIQSITHCPYCEEKLINDPVLRCVNNNCPSRMIGKIVNYVDKMDIRGISIGLVTTLFRFGYLTSIQDLYRLKSRKADIIQIDGIGPKMIENIIDSINSRRTVYDYNLLGSLGIPDVGPKIFKNILNIYYIDDIMEIAKNHNVSKLIEIPGIQEKMANKIIIGLLLNNELIEFLKDELLIKHDKKKYKMKVLFTKVRDKKFEDYLEKKDIEVCDGYSKKIDIVICEDSNTTSEKIKKAKKDGKKIMSLNEAYKYFKYSQTPTKGVS